MATYYNIITIRGLKTYKITQKLPLCGIVYIKKLSSLCRVFLIRPFTNYIYTSFKGPYLNLPEN